MVILQGWCPGVAYFATDGHNHRRKSSGWNSGDAGANPEGLATDERWDMGGARPLPIKNEVFA